MSERDKGDCDSGVISFITLLLLLAIFVIWQRAGGGPFTWESRITALEAKQ